MSAKTKAEDREGDESSCQRIAEMLQKENKYMSEQIRRLSEEKIKAERKCV